MNMTAKLSQKVTAALWYKNVSGKSRVLKLTANIVTVIKFTV